jgi:hypothetical protein
VLKGKILELQRNHNKSFDEKEQWKIIDSYSGKKDKPQIREVQNDIVIALELVYLDQRWIAQ